MKLRILLAIGLLLPGCATGASTPYRPTAAVQSSPFPATPTIEPSADTTGLSSPKAAAFREFAEAVNRGDVSSALAVVTDDIIWERGNQCPAGTCIGKQAVQREITRDVMAHHKLTLVSIDTSTANPIIRLETRNDGTRRVNVDRVIQLFRLELRGDKIAAVRVSFDLSDPVTAAFVASQSGTQPH